MALRSSLAVSLLAGALALACGVRPEADGSSADDRLTGVTASERGIHFQGYVHVAVDASDDDVKVAIARQVKTAIGALRTPKVSLNDRAAQSNLDPSTWTKNVLAVVDPASPSAAPRQVLRVTYKYNDRAV